MVTVALTLAGGLLGGAALLVDVVKDLLDHVWLRNRGDDPQLAAAPRAHLDIYLEHPFQSLCPGKRSQGIVGFSIGIDGGL